jgi:hypothetical protein
MAQSPANEDVPVLEKLQLLLSSGESQMKFVRTCRSRTMDTDKARQALEPVFSFEDRVSLQSFNSVFRADLSDPALLAATFAVTGGVLDQDCLRYQTKTMRTLRESISAPAPLATTSTLGAILLLAGVEVRVFDVNNGFMLIQDKDAAGNETSGGTPPKSRSTASGNL